MPLIDTKTPPIKTQNPRIMVLGSIGYGGIDKIRELYNTLQNEGFDVLKHVDMNGMDYSHVKDFRHETALSREIVESDLKHVDMADILVVLCSSPSWGTAMEMYYGRLKNKTVILLAKDSLPTPWPVHYSNYTVESEDGLIRKLHELSA